jgi:hypothetical protein
MSGFHVSSSHRRKHTHLRLVDLSQCTLVLWLVCNREVWSG